VRRLLAVALSMLWPALAQACAVCGSANDGNRMAFFWTTVLLSLVPLGLIGGGLLWLRRVAGARLAGEFREREVNVPAVDGAALPEPAPETT
jgi:hypothetical protein